MPHSAEMPPKKGQTFPDADKEAIWTDVKVR